MGEYLKKVSTQIADFLKGLTPAKKAALVGTSLAIVAGMAVLFMWAGEKTYVPLMTNLNGEDAANVIRILREKQIPFKVDPTGKIVSVSPESLYDLRLQLATMGMPQSSVVGYEVFDKQSLGTTSFVQKMNQKRALEGELMRTISQIKGVRHSRVLLALPQKSTFVEDQKKSSASVALDLEPGTVLNEKQVFGIGNLVARAVEGMEVSDVVIVDGNGKMLSKNNHDPLAAATATQLEFQTRMEQEKERQIEAMLARVVGDGRVVAKVNADLDFSQVTETQTTYDQDGAAVRSVDKRNDSMNGTRPSPIGPAGAAANLPGQAQSNTAQIKTDTVKSAETVNYEIPQTVKKIMKPVGSLKRLSVAVVIDQKALKAIGATAGNKEGAAQQSAEISAERLKEFEAIVASAAGIDRKRGDVLEIKSMEFAREDFDEAQRIIAEKEKRSYIQNMITYGVIGLAIILFFLLVVRPFIKWITENTIDSVDSFLPQTIDELERMQKNTPLPGLEETIPVLPEKLDPEKVEGEMIREKIITLVDANPHKAALILKDWLLPAAAKGAPKDAAAPAGGGKGKSA